MRTRREEFTFSHAFRLAGLGGLRPAGKHPVVTEEEEIAGLSFLARKRVAVLMHLPATDIASAKKQIITVRPRHLVAAQTRDAYRDQP